MEKYFATYNQSLALKELGFDEPCLAVYAEGSKQLIINNTIRNWNDQLKNGNTTSAPLKSQVFDWFREKHMLGHEINCPFISYQGKLACIKNEGKYELYITDEDQLSLPDDIFYSTDYFEAESKAIDKLIELVKNAR